MDSAPEGWHRHPNGGGLVQDTAHVDETAYVGPDARVSGHAWVYGESRVSGHAWVYGESRVSGDAEVYGGVWPESPPQMVIGRWYGHMRDAGTVAIGCQKSPVDADLDAWVTELAGRHDATRAEIIAARAFCAYVKQWRELTEVTR